MSGDIVDELQFRVTVTRIGGQHTVREVMSDIMAMENARAEIVRLRQWKDEATTVIGDWEAVFDALIDPKPANLGASKSVLVAMEIVRLSSEVERLRAVLSTIDNAHEPQADTDLDSLTMGGLFCTEDDEPWPCRTHLLLHPEEA